MRYIYTMKYFSAINNNKNVPFAEMWMDLEILIQSEVSQAKKKQIRVLMHVCGIYKNIIDDLTCKAEIETEMQRIKVWIQRGKVCVWDRWGDGD